jgi:hypothetical protein
LAKECVFTKDLIVGSHEQVQTVWTHVGERLVPEGALAIEGELALGRGIGSEGAIESNAFSRGTEQGEQGVGDGTEKEQPVATAGIANVRRLEAMPKWMSLVSRKVSSMEKRLP